MSINDKWIKKTWYLRTTEYNSTLKKKKILPFVTTRTDLKDIMLTEISQTHKNKYLIISHVESKIVYSILIAILNYFSHKQYSLAI